MVDLESFLDATRTDLGRDLSRNPEQYDIVSAPIDQSMKVVAGPGSGKTTVLVLRILKAIYVDGVEPSEIMATTFTRRAASEMRSRILSWGEKLRHTLLENADDADRERLLRVNFGAVVMGTIDSLSQSVMTEYRLPSDRPPAIIEPYVQRMFMSSAGYSVVGFDDEGVVSAELNQLFNTKAYARTKNCTSTLFNLRNRMKENMIPLDVLEDKFPKIHKILDRYESKLEERCIVDYLTMEENFLRFIRSEKSEDFTKGIKLLMVDEYQDTNRLQEGIYLELGRHAIHNGGSVIVVGDDDQSIYRFRGSKVVLFTDLEERAKEFGIRFNTRFLSINYRSTPSIISFCNDFIHVDDKYAKSRISSKPDMYVGRKTYDDYPVFCILEKNKADLAAKIAELIDEFVTNGEYTFHGTDESEWKITRDEDGSSADVGILFNSAKLFKYDGQPRLPYMIYSELRRRNSDIIAFNPRGTQYRNVDCIRKAIGILGVLLSPEKDYLVGESKDLKEEYRRIYAEAKEFISFAVDSSGRKLSDFVDDFHRRCKANKGSDEVGTLDVLYSIVPWVPELLDTVEGCSYLEVLTRTIQQSSIFNSRVASLEMNDKGATNSSMIELYKLFVSPILNSSLDIDEELFETLPDDHLLDIMTIHQSKGLEFPITIIDVSSDFKTNHWRQARNRFPRESDETSLIDRFINECLGIESPTGREELDPIFDDLIRKYFVAFSRAQDVLILVGLDELGVPNMGTGYDRTGKWKFESKFVGNGIVRMR